MTQRRAMRRMGLIGLIAWTAAWAVAGPSVAAAVPRAGVPHRIPELDLTLVWIVPGTFWMESTNGTGDGTRVTITRGFWLGRTEVTQAQWQAVARHIPGYEHTPLPSTFRGLERPVENVSWDMAVLFSAKLNELERAAGRLPEGYEYDLPTEAQWEYACRAGAEGTHIGKPDEMGWYVANSGGTTHPVARKQPNAWGLYDMQGNVAEWCADWYAGYRGGEVADPIGPASGIYRVLRGGSFSGVVGYMRPSMRNYWKSSLAGSATGMRVALRPLVAGGATPLGAIKAAADETAAKTR